MIEPIQLVAFFILLVKTLASEWDFTVEIPPSKMSCYFQTVTDPKYAAMEIDYQVIDGGDLNINFIVLIGGNVLVQDRMKTDNSHRINVKDNKGDFQLCFDNTFSYQDRKVVFFEIFLYDENNQLDNVDFNQLAGSVSLGAMSESAARVTKMASSLKANLNKAEHVQNLLRAFEARDRAIMEANYARVNFWSIVNSGVMVFVAIVQVKLIQSLFEENSKIGRLIRGSNMGRF